MFYKILVGSPTYHGSEPLTYKSQDTLEPGSVVRLPLGRRSTLGVVLEKTPKPSFATKEVTSIVAKESLPPTSLQLLKWLTEYYPAPSGSITQLFIPSNLQPSSRTQASSSPSSQPKLSSDLPPLTPEQNSVVQAITQKKASSFLLHGETGTGKTRVYIEVATRQLAKGRSVMILVPEISLTSQIAGVFETVFGDRVITVHSKLTNAERRDKWLKILGSHEPLVVLGARSALFYPIKSLGLIVVDEAHEAAYKQEQAPRYLATRVASKLAELHGATLIFGTATPGVTDYFVAQSKSVPILRMLQLATTSNASAAPVTIIDLKDKAQFTRHSFLSNSLLEAIQHSLDQNEQSLVFLNRRGTARIVLCSNCGWQALCPTCDLPLTYHGDSHDMRCHTCGYKTPALSACPDCHGTDIVFKNIGTKAIEEALTQLFPSARIQRFDTDNKKTERFEQHYQAISEGKVDILVGTQLLAKGLDLPKLGLVGVVAADTSLYLPDYTAEERTFQLLTQVLGRIGRGHRASQAIIQTYNPLSPVIQAAITHDWKAFYKQQLAERKLYRFPPFAYLLKISGSRASHGSIIKACDKLIKDLKTLNLPIQIIGPSPCFHEKTAGKYHWQIVVKAKNRSHLLEIIPVLPKSWSYDLDPVNLL